MNSHTVSKFIAGREDFGKILLEVERGYLESPLLPSRNGHWNFGCDTMV